MESALQDAFDYCAQCVRASDKDRFIAALFAPADRRPYLHALYAFDLELAQIAERVREPMAGEIRLQWWREVLEGQRAAEAAGNPVAAALAETIARVPLPPEPLSRFLDARSIDHEGEPVSSLAGLESYALATDGAIMRCAVLALGRGGMRELEPLLAHASAAVTLCRVLRRFAADAARQRYFVPADMLVGRDVHEADIASRRATPGLRAALAELRVVARAHVEQALTLLRRAPADARPAFLHLAVLPLVLDRMERSDYDPFMGPVDVPPWRRQWRLWRAARAR